MRFISYIAPLLLGASLVASKRFKGGGSGGSHGSSGDGEEDQQQGGGFVTTDTTTAFSSEETYDVGEVISTYYPSGVPTLAPAVSTTLASALLAVETSWYASPEWTSLDSAVSSAVTAAPLDVQNSVAVSGWSYDAVVTADWFVNGVPTRLQNAMASEYTALVNAAERATSTATAQGNGAMRSSAPVAIAGLVGIFGAAWVVM